MLIDVCVRILYLVILDILVVIFVFLIEEVDVLVVMDWLFMLDIL